MTSYEQLGLFYLGRRYDLASRTRLPEPVLYDSKDLLTHAVCVGMTGSGKTGLGIAMIEEAAIDGVPVLAIDPKGDLANLLLTFPSMSAADFAPWVTPQGAESRDALAAKEAAGWTAGLAEWDQTPARAGRLREAADIRLYTPGSRTATPLALLGSLRAPEGLDEEDAAAWAASTASSLLSIAGVEDTGPQSREQTLLATILSSAGTEATLPWLVQQIARPSFDRVGVLDLETFFPAKDRQALALRFNNVLASPGFNVWLAGEPLDIGALLHTPEGRPRVAIVSIAHLDDPQRMLVVSMLLNAVVAWTRRQSGTTSLRALVYMDEVFGYLPPVANPPSKAPLLTLLKQARAFGVGIMLATQNPVDLDYKALSNAGTWFLGKLQTERDKARVLDGIEGLSSSIDRATLDRTLSGLQKRVFFMHDVHESQPTIFETRWTLSYLRGPMSREELKLLAGATKPDATPAAPTSSPADAAPAVDRARAAATPPPSTAGTKPVLPAGIKEFYLPSSPSAGTTRFVPVLYGAARVRYTDAKKALDETADVLAVAPFSDGAVPVDWENAELIDVTPDQLAPSAPPGTGSDYLPVPSAALAARSYADWQRDFEQWIGRAQGQRLLSAPSLGLTSRVGESERDFQIRVQQAAREARDAAVEKLRARYAPRVDRVQAKIKSAQDAVGREQQQSTQQKLQSAVSIGSTLLGALLGRKALSMSTLGRATTAARGMGRVVKESQDIAGAEARVTEAQSELAELEAELASETAKLESVAAVPIEALDVKPKRGGVDVRIVTLAWRAVP
jgi:hypothetical protein